MRLIVPIRAAKHRTVFHVRFSSLFLPILFFHFAAAGQTDNQTGNSQITALTLGQTIQREIAGGQKHSFELPCVTGQYYALPVEQRGVDILVRLLDADEKVILEYDADPRITGEENVEFVSERTANCRLTVEPRQKAARRGSYSIKWTESRASTEKEKALDEARRLLVQATRLWRATKYDEALPLAERTLAIRERELGPEHADVGLALFMIANIYSDLPDFKKAEVYYSRAIDVRSKALGPEHFSLASIYNNFGTVYKDLGQYTKAEALYQKALDIRERVLEPDHLLIASAMNNLATIARLRGDEVKAADLYRRVLEIREKALGPDDPDVATAVNNLANQFSDVATAEPLYLRALAIREKRLPPDHPDIAQTLYNLAVLYSSAGEVAKADAACVRALAIYEKALGLEHPFTTYPLNLSATIAKNKGEFDKAEQLYERTILIKEKVQGAFHPDLGGTYANLANLYAIKGEIEKAIAAQTRANEIFEYNISLNLMTGSERDKANYIRTLSYIGDQTLSLNSDAATKSKAAAELGLTFVLQRKGRVLDAMSDNMKSLRGRLNQQDQSFLDELTDTTSKLSEFVLNGPQELSKAEYQKKLADFEAKRESLERRISRQSGGYYEASVSSPLAAVRRQLLPHEALIEFAVYRPVLRKLYEFSIDDQARPEAFGNPRYMVFVLQPSAEIVTKDLGETKAIDALIFEFRKALRSPSGRPVQKAARAVEEAVIKPIRSALGDANHLLISADGQLNLIPFEALVDEGDQYLIEKFSFSYLTSGRDLVRNRNVADRGGKPIIIADPVFGEPDRMAAGAAKSNARSRSGSLTNTRSLSDTYFAPLGGTAQEARSIQTLFPDAVAYIGSAATETALKKAVAPRILHLATHGFFLDAGEPQSGGKVKPAGAPRAASYIENPLLRSGLALAGANRRGGGADDGILTALEASGLNLWGTKLVVLSACDTGVGEVRNGEGVYGLRRSFQIAGAETLVMSLWPVSDYVTRELMTGYYKNLKQGIGRGESLRRIQLEMLKKPNRRHPFYWASFIQSGEWANLDGKR